MGSSQSHTVVTSTAYVLIQETSNVLLNSEMVEVLASKVAGMIPGMMPMMPGVAIGIAVGAMGMVVISAVSPHIFNSFNKPPTRIPPEIIAKEAMKYLPIDTKNNYNIAVVGSSGSGKSSIVNAIRGLSARDEHAAPVGSVETTLNQKPYQHPKFKRVIIWDCPGGSTPGNPAVTYFEDKFLQVFTALLIVTSSRILEIDIHLIRNAQKFGIPFFILRNKSDIDISSKMNDKDMDWASAASELCKEVRPNFQKELDKAGLGSVKLIYIVSAIELRKYFNTLTKSSTNSSSKSIDEVSLVNDLAHAMHSN